MSKEIVIINHFDEEMIQDEVRRQMRQNAKNDEKTNTWTSNVQLYYDLNISAEEMERVVNTTSIFKYKEL